MTQERLAEELGVDVRSVRDWEGGRRTPRTAARLGEICDVLEAPREALGLRITTAAQWVRPILASSFDTMETTVDGQGPMGGATAGGQIALSLPVLQDLAAVRVQAERLLGQRAVAPTALERWECAVDEHVGSYATRPPVLLLGDLLLDFTDVTATL